MSCSLFFFFFFDMSTQRGRGRNRTSDLHFMRRDLQQIELSLEDVMQPFSIEIRTHPTLYLSDQTLTSNYIYS
jgi:hypothetical protein